MRWSACRPPFLSRYLANLPQSPTSTMLKRIPFHHPLPHPRASPPHRLTLLRQAHHSPLAQEDLQGRIDPTNPNAQILPVKPPAASPPSPRNGQSGLHRSLILPICAGSAVITAIALSVMNKGGPPDSDIVHVGTFDGRGGWLAKSDAPSFTYTFKGGKFGIGGERTSVHALMPLEETEGFLKANEKTTVVDRPGNPMVRVDENVLPSKTACEDRHAVDIIPRAHLASLLAPYAQGTSFWDSWAKAKVSAAEPGDGSDDIVMISVFDGHCGSPGTSDLLKKTIHPCIAWMLASASSSYSFPDPTLDSGVFGQSIHDAYKAWDAATISAPFALLENKIQLPDVSGYRGFPNPALVVLADPPSRGSAGITAVIDVKADTLHVANLGDSRAVAGWWNPEDKVWRCDILSNDHEPENPAEADRLRSEHPPEEADDVVFDAGYWKRVLGTGQPSRAFGNTSYKLPMDEQDRLAGVLGGNQSKTTKPVLTPPYKTAEPEVISRHLHPASGEELKFLVVAADGLWDWTSSEEAALLLSAHLNHPHAPDIPKTVLPALHPYLSPSEPRPYPAETLPGQEEKATGEWVFEDTNAATHLIRNALGGKGWDRDVRRKVLSMREGGTRVVRDDTTVIVAWFDEHQVRHQELRIPVEQSYLIERLSPFEVVHRVVD